MAVTGRRGTLTRIAPSVTLETSPAAFTPSPMVRSGDGYELKIAALERSFKYRVTAGPAVSRAYSVTALHPSRVQRIELHYDYPSFSGLKPRAEADGGDVYGPAGTRVRLVVHTDKAVATGALAFSEGKPALALARVDDRTLESTLTVQEEGAYRVGLVDPDGLTSEGIAFVRDGRPPAGRPHPPSERRHADHPADEAPIEAPTTTLIASLDMVYLSGGAEKVAVHDARRHQSRAHDRGRWRRRDLARQARRRHRVLRAKRDIPRQAVDAVAQRDLLPRGRRSTRSTPRPEPGGDGREAQQLED